MVEVVTPVLALENVDQRRIMVQWFELCIVHNLQGGELAQNIVQLVQLLIALKMICHKHTHIHHNSRQLDVHVHVFGHLHVKILIKCFKF